MLARLELLFLLFIAYAVLGWCMEVTCKLIQFHRFINRGFLIGPYCPIYGVGGVAITLLLDRYKADPTALFIMGMVICSILEYFTSWIMEKLFHARWWDYSSKRFNLNGRICLNTMVPFGLLGVAIMDGINPVFYSLVDRLSPTARHILCGVLAAGFLFDLVVSTTILSSIRQDNKVLDKDNTEEMAARVREVIASRGWAHRRLLDAFPQVRHIGVVLKENMTELRTTVVESAVETRDRIVESAANTRERMVESAANTRERLAESTSETRAKLEAELARLEESQAAAEREFRRRRQELEKKLERFKPKK